MYSPQKLKEAKGAAEEWEVKFPTIKSVVSLMDDGYGLTDAK